MLTGKNGILRQAGKAKKETEIAGEKEQIQLAYTECLMSSTTSNVKSEQLFNQLNLDKADVKTVYGEDELIIIMNNKNVYELDKNGDIQFGGIHISYTEDKPIISRDKLWSIENKDRIIEIQTKTYIAKPENTIMEFDVSTMQNKSVMAYLIEDNNNFYKLYLMANGKIYMGTNANSAFSKFTNLELANLKNIDTINVTDMSYIFDSLKKLKKINIENWDTSNVTSMYFMFKECENLEDIKVTNFDTANVTSMGYMFFGCKSLKELDLTSFNTKNVSNMNAIFNGCNNLKTIYVSALWSIESLINDNTMFNGCINLIGGNGTRVNINNSNKLFARIDRIGEPGYLTEK